LQGPSAEAVLGEMVPSSAKLHEMKFMAGKDMEVLGAISYVQRSGYTGEDGFEVRKSFQNFSKIKSMGRLCW